MRSIQSVHSLCAYNNMMWLSLDWVNVDWRNVFKRQSAENVLSALAVVTRIVKKIFLFIYISE